MKGPMLCYNDQFPWSVDSDIVKVNLLPYLFSYLLDINTGDNNEYEQGIKDMCC